MLVGIKLLVPPPRLSDGAVPLHEERLVIVDFLLPDGHILPPLGNPVSDYVGYAESGYAAFVVPSESNMLLEVTDGCVTLEKDDFPSAIQVEYESNAAARAVPGKG